MPFSDLVRSAARQRAGGRCECTRLSCGHLGRCNTPLIDGDWECHHRTAVSSGGDDSLSNAEALCGRCHRNTGSFGRH